MAIINKLDPLDRSAVNQSLTPWSSFSINVARLNSTRKVLSG
jgi:hypothetical protein